MTAFPALALCGSDPTGDVGFSCSLRLADGHHLAAPPPGRRGDLAALADGLCRAHGVAPADLRELRVDLGPGSYTGLRVAVTFVRCLARFGGVPVLATDTLLLLADAAAAGLPPGRHLRPLLDARRGLVLAATVGCDDGTLHLRNAPAACDPADLVARAGSGDRFVVPRGLAERLGDDLRARGAEVVVAERRTADGLWSPRLPMQACAPDRLEPRYLLGSYAEG